MNLYTLIALGLLTLMSLFSQYEALIWICAFFIMFVIRFGGFEVEESPVYLDRWEFDGDLLLMYGLGWKTEKLVSVFRLPRDPEIVLRSDEQAVLMNHRLYFRRGNAAEFFEELCAYRHPG